MRLGAALLWLLASAAAAGVPSGALQYRATLVREAQFVYGVDAPIPMFAGQIHQESRWRADVTAWDNGRGLAQFMDGTAAQVARSYPELGAPDPYNPRWAIRAMVRLDRWNYLRVQGAAACDRWAASLKAYNAGLGYVQRAQRRSSTPAQWFGATELVNAGQSAKNFEYSRLYPRWILLKHQPLYAAWGPTLCEGVQ
jgi:soluble lytic murein transglycosylase-like protein